MGRGACKATHPQKQLPVRGSFWWPRDLLGPWDLVVAPYPQHRAVGVPAFGTRHVPRGRPRPSRAAVQRGGPLRASRTSRTTALGSTVSTSAADHGGHPPSSSATPSAGPSRATTPIPQRACPSKGLDVGKCGLCGGTWGSNPRGRQQEQQQRPSRAPRTSRRATALARGCTSRKTVAFARGTHLAADHGLRARLHRSACTACANGKALATWSAGETSNDPESRQLRLCCGRASAAGATACTACQLANQRTVEVARPRHPTTARSTSAWT